LAFPWEIISSIVGFLLMVILVGRYSKKQRVE